MEAGVPENLPWLTAVEFGDLQGPDHMMGRTP